MRSARVVPVAVLALVAAGLGACGSGERDAGGEPSSTAAQPGSDPSTQPAPEPAPSEGVPAGVTGVGEYVWRIGVLPDGGSALVGTSAGFFPRTRTSAIVELTALPDGTWGDARPASFSSEETADLDPFVTNDGARVWFSSIRPVDGAARTDTDLWYVDRLPDGTYGEPVNPGPVVNSPAEDLYPTVGPDGALYFGSDREGSGFDVYRAAAEGEGWAAPVALREPVTSPVWEFNPAIAPDGSTLVFTSISRTGGSGLGDLWFSAPEGDGWGEPQPLSVNTPGDEYHASFSPDGTLMYFVRDGVLHEIPVGAAGLP